MKPHIPTRYSIPFLLAVLLCCARGTLIDFLVMFVFYRYLARTFSFI
jgi:hypothetical protein